MYFVRDVSITDWQTLGYHDFNVLRCFFSANDAGARILYRHIDHRYTLFQYSIRIRHIEIRRK